MNRFFLVLTFNVALMFPNFLGKKKKQQGRVGLYAVFWVVFVLVLCLFVCLFPKLQSQRLALPK